MLSVGRIMCCLAWLPESKRGGWFVLLCSVKKTRQAHHFPANIHEVTPNETETEATRDPEREGVRVRSGRASPQLWP